MKLLRKFVCAASVAAISACLVIPSMAATAQWKRNDRGWWYEEANGSYPTATWKLINNKWYYFDGIGYMAESRWIGNYYVGADGAMLVSTVTPDGYYVDETGKWIEGKRASLHVSKSSTAGKRRSGGGGGVGGARGLRGLSGGDAHGHRLPGRPPPVSTRTRTFSRGARRRGRALVRAVEGEGYDLED